MKSQTTIAIAKIAIAGVITYNVILTVLIFIKSDLDPYWHTISEYAFGSFGWLMTVAFLCSALAYASILVAIKSEIKGVVGHVGLAILFICAVATIGVGLFKTDPLTTPQNQISTPGMIHMISGGAALFLLPFAAMLINLSLAFRNKNWQSSRKLVLFTAGVPMLGLAGFIAHYVIHVAPLGENAYGPGVPIGYPPRALFLTYMIWLITLAIQTQK